MTLSGDNSGEKRSATQEGTTYFREPNSKFAVVAMVPPPPGVPRDSSHSGGGVPGVPRNTRDSSSSSSGCGASWCRRGTRDSSGGDGGSSWNSGGEVAVPPGVTRRYL